jgi:hypothetical protein
MLATEKMEVDKLLEQLSMHLCAGLEKNIIKQKNHNKLKPYFL